MKAMVAEGEGHAPFLHKDIITNILKRLPVKSLLRFQCVCNHWKTLIHTPSFVAQHLRLSSTQNLSLLITQSTPRKPLNLDLLHSDMHVRHLQNPPLIASLRFARVIGSCNGLLSIADRPHMCPYTLFLWNPATGEFTGIPRARAVESRALDYTFGFGFCPVVNDYKIVKIHAKRITGVVCGVEVFSLSTGLWKGIEFGSLEGVRLCGDAITAPNGSVHWYACGVEEDDQDDVRVIVLFDLAREVFAVIPYPPLCDHWLSIFSVYEDRFAMLSITRIVDFPNLLHSLIDLWVLEEDIGPSTEGCSWTKKFSSKPCPIMLELATIWKNEIVCSDLGIDESTDESGDEMEDDEQEVGMCFINISTNEMKEFVIHTCVDPHNVFNHVESLVPVAMKNLDPEG